MIVQGSCPNSCYHWSCGQQSEGTPYPPVQSSRVLRGTLEGSKDTIVHQHLRSVMIGHAQWLSFHVHECLCHGCRHDSCHHIGVQLMCHHPVTAIVAVVIIFTSNTIVAASNMTSNLQNLDMGALLTCFYYYKS